MEAGKRSINDIFNGNRILEIPFFQRSYVWKKEQWERFLEDMEVVTEENKPYFLGSLILKQQETRADESVGDRRTVIDGQQRLTTLNIFFKVLSLKTGKNYFQKFQLENPENNEKTLALRHNHNDKASFERVLGFEKLEEDKIQENNILGVYNFFQNEIKLDKLNPQKILNNVMFVGIDLGVEEDEQQIFDTINSLGVGLSTAELLKNYFFEGNNTSDYETYWKELF